MTAKKLAEAILALPEEDQDRQICQYDSEYGEISITGVRVKKPSPTNRIQWEPYVEVF
jgi:hypothetical protein